MLMRIIDRYIISAFLKNYAITLIVLVGLYIVMDMVFNFDELAEMQQSQSSGGVATFVQIMYHIVDYYFYQSLLFFTNLAPVIPGVAASFTLIRLSRSNELVAIMAAGVPLLRVALPIILTAVALTSLVIVNQELVIPNIIPQLMRGHDQVGGNTIRQGQPVRGIRDAQTNAFFRAARYTPATGDTPATIEYLDVLDRTPDGQVVGHLSADQATWEKRDGQWQWLLTNGRYVRIGSQVGSGEPTTMLALHSTISPEVIALYRKLKVAELLSTHQINQLLSSPQAFGTEELVRVKHTRWAGVLLNIVMLLMSIPAVLTREPRIIGPMAVKCGILVATLMGLVFITNSLAARPPQPQWLDQWAAFMAFLPIFIFGPISIHLLRQIKS
ncbi:MAG: LptF/LptG family permease [Phycisphaerales bacterium]|nr:LptF/LptG family permease [Phycisphaerales bacterium]